jgi:uncharacterized protein YjbI with pentapeptide repeats
MVDEQPLRLPCSQDDCIGIQLPGTAWCLGHAAEQAPDAFNAELTRISSDGTVDARGVMISAELLAQLLDATPRKDGRSAFTAARFDGASFQGEARFEGASFQGVARFDRASFQGDAVFDRANFQERAWFDGASFHKVASFRRVSFERATQVGSLLASQLDLDGALFRNRVHLVVTAAVVCARQSRFPAGVHLRLRYASVALDDADLAGPAILAGARMPFPTLEEQDEQLARRWERLQPGPRSQRWRPRLLSIRRADVTGLHLANMDLRACRFAGAHNLDRLRIEGAPLFIRTTGWWRARRKTLAEEQHWRANRPGRWRPAGWYPQACQPPTSRKAKGPVEAPELVEPARLAAVYRELRKGREDAKDEPGAADFYYGECEMRRHDPGTPRAERLVLWAYWLVSGYALRASRAVLAWALLVVVGAATLAGIGFKPPTSPQIVPIDARRGQVVYEKREVARPSSLEQVPEALAFSAESTVSLFRAPDRALTLPGRWMQMILRVLGPVLLGLLVLSLRGRVRR